MMNRGRTINASQPGHDSKHPSTEFAESGRPASEKDPIDDASVNNDPEQAQLSASTGVKPPQTVAMAGSVCCASFWLTCILGESIVVFLAHYLEMNRFPGASDLQFAFIGGLSLSMSQFIAPVATIITRKWGTKTTLLIGIILQTASLLGASWATKVWQLFLSQAVGFGFGMGMQFSATVGIIPQWFDRRRSLANGIGTAGSGIGGLIYSLATGAMIQRWGTGWAFRVLAIVSAAACGFSAVTIKDRNKVIGSVQNAFHATLLKRPEFVLTLAWGCFSVLGYVALLFSIPSYATTVGLNATQGAILGAMFNLGGGLGRPLIGYVSDDFGRINTALVCTFLSGLFSLVIWIFARSFGVLIFYALIGGAVAPTFTTTVAPVSIEVVGLQLLPSALSIVWLTVVIPSTFAEPIALWLRTDGGTNFLHAQIFTGFMFMGAAICLWLVRAWKISELEKTGANADLAKRDAAIKDDVAVPDQSVVTSTASRDPRVASKAKAKGLFMLVKV